MVNAMNGETANRVEENKKPDIRMQIFYDVLLQKHEQ
jgi:hypothetical protein